MIISLAVKKSRSLKRSTILQAVVEGADPNRTAGCQYILINMETRSSFGHVLVVVLLLKCYASADDSRPGHLQPFGTGPSLAIPEVTGFPDSHSFFTDHVYQSVPLKMTGAVINTEAFRKWDDDYFLALNEPSDYKVLVETTKKEDRNQETLQMSFHEFIRSYNTTERYMVETVPPFLRKDFPLPLPLHCEDLVENFIADAIMWFSSGGTKSVVHTDSLENINCVIRGTKTFVMVDPHKYGDQVDIDRKNGAYSTMDVDKVDMDKFPAMAGVEFYHVNLTAGDCVYIPYKWIHQVRSFERNIAINLWWDHHATVDLSSCHAAPSHTLTLDQAPLQKRLVPSWPEARDFMIGVTVDGPVSFQEMHDYIIGDNPVVELDAGGGYKVPLQKIFNLLDIDGDDTITSQETEQLTQQDWEEAVTHMEWFSEVLAALEEHYYEGRAEDDWSEEDRVAERDEL